VAKDKRGAAAKQAAPPIIETPPSVTTPPVAPTDAAVPLVAHMRWEYCRVKILLSELDVTLARLGRDGWELSHTHWSDTPVATEMKLQLIFKRPA